MAASVNAPVNVGDYLSTTLAIRAPKYSSMLTISFAWALTRSSVSPNSMRTTRPLQLAAGTIELRMFKYVVDPQVDTPSISIRPNVAGQYRVSVATIGARRLPFARVARIF